MVEDGYKRLKKIIDVKEGVQIPMCSWLRLMGIIFLWCPGRELISSISDIGPKMCPRGFDLSGVSTSL